MDTFRILIIDDEEPMRQNLRIILKNQKYTIDLAQDGDEAWCKFQQEHYDLVITDVIMPGKSGMELLGLINRVDPDVPIIVITGHGTIDKAVQAMKRGAYDYITKPFENEKIKMVVSKALTFSNLKNENRILRKAIRARYNFKDFIGESSQIKKLLNLAERIARDSSTVLVQGESGTGKEILVKYIHYNSDRAACPFIDFSCANITDSTAESELFGHEKGAFTGAYERKIGRFEQAHTGTIFLDEVGELSLNVQARLLRVLEERRFVRHGGTKPVEVDVRVIAATHRDLSEMVYEGSFREDLYFRLNILPIYIPPLREHKEDIPFLVEHFLKEFSREKGKQVPEVSKEAMDLLRLHPWQGNVRELKTCLLRSLLSLYESKIITPKELMFDQLRPNRTNTSLNIDFPPEGIDLEKYMGGIIANYLKTALTRVQGNKAKAARLLNISRNKLRDWLEKYNIDLNA